LPASVASSNVTDRPTRCRPPAGIGLGGWSSERSYQRVDSPLFTQRLGLEQEAMRTSIRLVVVGLGVAAALGTLILPGRLTGTGIQHAGPAAGSPRLSVTTTTAWSPPTTTVGTFPRTVMQPLRPAPPGPAGVCLHSAAVRPRPYPAGLPLSADPGPCWATAHRIPVPPSIGASP
jgi:hypothetical protein